MSYLALKFVFSFKSRLIFKRFYCFCMFANKRFINTGAYISKSKRGWNAKPSGYHFYVKTKMLDFHICMTPFFINNQKFKQSPRKSNLFNSLPGQTRDKNQTIHCENRLKPFFCIGNLREMLTFGLISSKVCIAYSRFPCNKLWQRLECLNN